MAPAIDIVEEPNEAAWEAAVAGRPLRLAGRCGWRALSRAGRCGLAGRGDR